MGSTKENLCVILSRVLSVLYLSTSVRFLHSLPVSVRWRIVKNHLCLFVCVIVSFTLLETKLSINGCHCDYRLPFSRRFRLARFWTGWQIPASTQEHTNTGLMRSAKEKVWKGGTPLPKEEEWSPAALHHKLPMFQATNTKEHILPVPNLVPNSALNPVPNQARSQKQRWVIQLYAIVLG